MSAADQLNETDWTFSFHWTNLPVRQSFFSSMEGASSLGTKDGVRRLVPSPNSSLVINIFLKCWANIGNFFAKHGIITVVATHQLVPHVQYPGGADDIQLVREWIYKNISSEKFGKGSVNKVILFGHSR